MTNQEILSRLESVRPTAAKRFEPRRIADSSVVYFAEAMAERGYVHTSETLDALRATLEGYDVCLVGDPGVGKTAFFEALSSVTFSGDVGLDDEHGVHHRLIDSGLPWRMARINMREVAWFSQADVEHFLRLSAGVPLLIDDVGGEPLTAYGQRNPISDMILEYRLNGSSQTFVTRNLRGKDASDRYGSKILSRLFYMKTFDLGTYALGSHSLRRPDRLRFEPRMWDLDHKSPCRDDDPVMLSDMHDLTRSFCRKHISKWAEANPGRPDAREMTEGYWCNMLPWPTNFISR